MSFNGTKLVCTKCKKEYTAEKPVIRCNECGDTLEVPLHKKCKIVKGHPMNQTMFERYQEFFPYFKTDNSLSLGEGFTPLINIPELADEVGVQKLCIKNESVNPTWSFKDRGSLAGIMRAIQLGYRCVGTVSTGNMAISMAAFGCRANLKTFILVNTHIDEEKMNPIAVYDPVLIKVDGDYAALYDESLNIGQKQGIYFVNSDEPFRIEGYRTLAFEICEQSNFDAPDLVVVPTSSGGHFRGILKGFIDFKKSGLINKIPTMVCAQTSGCATINNAYEQNLEDIERTIHPDTIAHSIENAFPPSGNAVLRALRKYNGICISVSDDRILSAQRRLSCAGLFVQPGSAASLAAVQKMHENGMLAGNERVVCVATSSGLKYTSILTRHDLSWHETRLEDLDDCILRVLS